MQFHQNGFEPGEPDVHVPALRVGAGGAKGPLPKNCDVLIVGCGPAGLTLAAQLARFPEIKTCIIEQKPSRLLLGQADGIACRTMEMFNAFGFAERVLREAYWVNETVFWKPAPGNVNHIARSGRVQDVEEGLSEFPHVILNQARVHDFYLDAMKNANGLEPYYGRKLAGLTSGADGATAQIEVVEGEGAGATETITAKYVVGCDGARSAVRKAMGLELHGDSANQAWGVMDVLANTDFPDVRFKCVVQSAQGSALIIPREGGYMFRVYVELDKLAKTERVADRKLTLEQLIAAANRIFSPYKLDVKEVPWWSVYEIGQRLTDRFDDGAAHPRVFIAGDACHTHSPKAGQGMNVSMQDTFNLGWKLAAVLQQHSPASLLQTYSAERKAIAQRLIDFDREWSGLLHKASKGEVSAAEVQKYFVEAGRYTAGTATVYAPALLTGQSTHQNLAAGFLIGTRFHSSPVIRLGDGKALHLGHCIEADGRWRLFAFADAARDKLAALCKFLGDDKTSPIRRFTPKGADIDSVFDLRAVLQQGHQTLAITDLPPLLFPPKGKLGLRDYEKVFCIDPKNDIFAARGVIREGALVIVRPDQYVGHVLPLDAHAALADYFAGFMSA